jgi:uncharacterized membrane protein
MQQKVNCFLNVESAAEGALSQHTRNRTGGLMETRIRSIVKALIWQVIGLSIMAVVGILITGSLSAGGAMALINTALGFVTYLVYERAWARIHWGRRYG